MIMNYKTHSGYKRMMQMKRKNIFWFVAGFADGESSFSMSFAKQKQKDGSVKWVINPAFQVYQHEDNLWFLEFLKNEVFKTGRIHRKTSPYSVFTFSIENRTTLHDKIIPFFRKYRLATKDADFQIFAKIISKIYNKEHLTYKGFKEIVDLAFKMNKNGKQRKFTKAQILKGVKQQLLNAR